MSISRAGPGHDARGDPRVRLQPPRHGPPGQPEHVRPRRESGQPCDVGLAQVPVARDVGGAASGRPASSPTHATLPAIRTASATASTHRLTRQVDRRRGAARPSRQPAEPSNSPTSCTSGSRATPNRSRPAAAPARSAPTTSDAVAPGAATMKFACFRDTVAPPTAQALRRPRLDQPRRVVARRVLEHAAAVRLREGLRRPPPRPRLVHLPAGSPPVARRRPTVAPTTSDPGQRELR